MLKKRNKNFLKIYNSYNNCGFTLIEIMAAIVVITIGMFAIMGVIIMIIKGNEHSKRNTTATTLAQDKIENIQNLGFGNASSAIGTEDYGDITGYNAFKRVTTIYTDTPAANMITGSVTVHWIPGTHSVTLITILSE